MSNKSKELRTYAVEIPSRDAVLEALEDAGVPLSDDELIARLGVKDAEEREGIARRIAAMEREGQVLRNRRGHLLLPDKAGLIKGKVVGHPDGFGFLQPEDGRDDLFLGPREMHKVLHGDIVLVRVVGTDRRGRLEAGIAEVLERSNRKVVGRLYIENDVAFVVAENKRISQDILIRPDSLGGAREGQVVVAEILSQPSKQAEPVGGVVEVLGNYADPGMEIEIALRKHDLPHEWPREVEAAAKKIGKKLLMRDLKGRRDLREMAFVTIDGETAKDFDDAVYAEESGPGLRRGDKKGAGDRNKKGAGYKLWVAIADVSHYVQPADALDREAYSRGNSVYFPRRVIPMLPEELSNELCSLKPDVDRLVMVCEMDIGASGVVKDYEFYPAVIHSHARLTYTRVAAALEGQAPDPPIDASLVPHLHTLDRVFRALLGQREKRGAIDFETVETQMIFDPNGKIEKIVPVKRNDAHRLIEECMLAANVCASDFLEKNEQPTLYRVHEGPTMEKLESLRAMLKDYGLSVGGGDEPKAKDYQELLKRIKGRPYASMLQTVMLRSLSQAVYTPENVGHFGLAYDAYAHFTSPIRRYPDLLVHRGIKGVLEGERYQAGDLNAVGRHCSETERRADDATRDVEAWLKSYFMQDHVGEEFDGTLSGVTSFGLFVTLDDLLVDGLVHISDLGQDYFKFDPQRHMLKGERSGVKYQLGGRVRVKVVRVNLEQAKIDFVLVEGKEDRPSPPTPLPGERGGKSALPGERGGKSALPGEKGGKSAQAERGKKKGKKA